jgi:hypothetical protein
MNSSVAQRTKAKGLSLRRWLLWLLALPVLAGVAFYIDEHARVIGVREPDGSISYWGRAWWTSELWDWL